MKVKVQNITVGALSFPDLQLGPCETKKVQLTDKIRYYTAAHYIKIVSMYPDEAAEKKDEKK